jgi:hypothetical protein
MEVPRIMQRQIEVTNMKFKAEEERGLGSARSRFRSRAAKKRLTRPLVAAATKDNQWSTEARAQADLSDAEMKRGWEQHREARSRQLDFLISDAQESRAQMAAAAARRRTAATIRPTIDSVRTAMDDARSEDERLKRIRAELAEETEAELQEMRRRDTASRVRKADNMIRSSQDAVIRARGGRFVPGKGWIDVKNAPQKPKTDAEVMSRYNRLRRQRRPVDAIVI